MDKELFKKKLEGSTENVLDFNRIQNILANAQRPLQENLNKNGTLNLIITMEEFGELQQQISKYIRGTGDHLALLEEVADAYICLDYIRFICGINDDELAKAINIKYDRQEERNNLKTW